MGRIQMFGLEGSLYPVLLIPANQGKRKLRDLDPLSLPFQSCSLSCSCSSSIPIGAGKAANGGSFVHSFPLVQSASTSTGQRSSTSTSTITSTIEEAKNRCPKGQCPKGQVRYYRAWRDRGSPAAAISGLSLWLDRSILFNRARYRARARPRSPSERDKQQTRDPSFTVFP